jgi:hypothetical protein
VTLHARTGFVSIKPISTGMSLLICLEHQEIGCLLILKHPKSEQEAACVAETPRAKAVVSLL